MIRAFGALALACLLSACATAGEPRVEVRTVKVPVAVACAVKPPERPTFAADGLDLSADIFAKVRALLTEREQRKAYEADQQAALKACQ